MARQPGRALRMLVALLMALGALAALPPAPVWAATIPVTNTNDGGAGSLRAALAAAEATPEADTIAISATGTIALTRGLDTLTRPVTIQGPGRDALTIQGNQTFALLYFNAPGQQITVSGVTFARGGAPGTNYGGCLWVGGGTVTLRDARVRDCAASGGGGGILQTGGSLTIERTELRGNQAGFEPTYGGGGGAIFVDQYDGDATLTIRDSVIAGNRALNGSNGGGLYIRRIFDRPSTTNPYMLTVVIERSTIGGPIPADANAASDDGGGIYNKGSSTTVTNSTIQGNTTADDGGGIYNDTQLTLTNVTVADNRAGSGGGMFNDGQTTLTNVTLSGNAASGNGGAFYERDGNPTLRFVTITGNVADADGNGVGSSGGIYRSDCCPTVFGSIVAGNRRGTSTPDDCGGIATLGYNLFAPGSFCPTTNATDIVYSGPISALLDPTLADNGGLTVSHGLVPGSPALDRIPPAQCAIGNDQRGQPRPQPTGGNCDIGAVEGVAQRLLAVATVGGGVVGRNPAGAGAGPFGYDIGTPVTLTPQPGAGQTFISWLVDGVSRGWASPLTTTMDANHTVQATFAPTASFPDVGTGRADHAAIVALATRGTIRGYANGNYGPDDGVQRAQMAALLARATTAGPDIPPAMLTPPACLVAGTWDCENWENRFSDPGGIDPNLWRNAGALQHYGVALGYSAADCIARGRAFPCYGPTDPVSYAQTITFITRMMRVKGYWLAQPGAPLPYGGVPGPHAEDVRTFAYYTGGVPAPPGDWSAGATRGWFALALWAALNAYWGTDGILPDGRPAGGQMP